jgi:crotonobetainyl-CoA:carnitine CoA-transferase CaiB-like acyl-CoA transferase
VDGQLLLSGKGAPRLGEHNEAIEQQFGIAAQLQGLGK